MQLANARILLTGASGGLGQALAQKLIDNGAAVLLAGRNPQKLSTLRAQLGNSASTVCADLTRSEGIAATAAAARDFGVNVVINNAGINAFGLFDEQDWAIHHQILAASLAAPIQLTHALLPWLKTQPQAAIVNIGSSFGSLPFAGFAVYSAAKAGLRGFSQALRRELADSAISVVHIAPRAIDTAMNSKAVNTLNQALGSQSDSANKVAEQILDALRRNEAERHIGFPERLFAWLNGVAPGLIDFALAGKLSTIKQHASQTNR